MREVPQEVWKRCGNGASDAISALRLTQEELTQRLNRHCSDPNSRRRQNSISMIAEEATEDTRNRIYQSLRPPKVIAMGSPRGLHTMRKS